MSQTLSAQAVREYFAQESGEATLDLLTLSHPDMDTVRLANNTVNVVSRGETFLAFPFTLRLPDDVADQISQGTLQISNIDRRLIEALRSIREPIAAQIELVLGSTPDVVEFGPVFFDLFPITYNAQTINATLAFENLISEPFPSESFTPQLFPGLFGRTGA